MPGDAEVMPEVGCMPSGQRTSPWSDGRTQDGADRAEAAFVFGHFCTYPIWKSPAALRNCGVRSLGQPVSNIR